MKKILIPIILTLALCASCVPKNVEKDAENTENSIQDVESTVVSSETDGENSEKADQPDSETGENQQGELPPGDDTNGKVDREPEEKDTPVNTIAAEFPDDRWIIKPSYIFDSLETFGKSGYSIYQKNGKYGILDMSARGIGTGDYTELFYCPTHGLSCPDILDTPVKMRDDLYLAPDCGYEYSAESEVIYVFDPTRDRVYVTGYSDGIFKIVDITETEFFKSSERYIVVLYDCDADIMMYEGIGMLDLKSIFASESKEMHYGVIDTDMDYVIACIYDEIRDGNDCYIVKKDGKYGYRATGGREYYPCVFEEANTAYKGAAWVKYGGLWGTVRF